ncbi:hypothetical protein [Chryseobacterium luquanense]|uniref:PQQ-like domain-containing protein n=1 Tax=Chryseobacterium luquanense TaxID=2983766 RepID=A0ABT3Y1C6_9FLAO|nr:hypothetical protein [Chryseobacterium luquanense]MCX8531901.1 hypothetical protein [Chryseobacterium luquanense]
MKLLVYLRYFLVFFSVSLFSQTQMYKSELILDDIKNQSTLGSIAIVDGKILFNSNNYLLSCLEKGSHKILWERKIGWRSNQAPFTFNDSFFYGNYDGESRKVHQYDINSGKTLQILQLQSINTKPYFKNSILYATAIADGGKLLAYDIENNNILWQQNINYGADVQPVYLKDKIIANAEDDLWFEIDYNGNFIINPSEIITTIDDKKATVKNFHFLSHDEMPITKEWLKKNKLANSEFKIEKNQNYTFLLNERYLTVLGRKGNKKLQLDLENLVSPDEYENESLLAILSSENGKIWFVYQNHLIHYDVKKEKILRNVYLNNWQPHQVILDGRNIWLISKNDGQLYHLDFEPDEDLNRKIQCENAIREHFKCDLPNPKKIKAAKAAEEKLKNTQAHQ